MFGANGHCETLPGNRRPLIDGASAKNMLRAVESGQLVCSKLFDHGIDCFWITLCFLDGVCERTGKPTIPSTNLGGRMGKRKLG